MSTTKRFSKVLAMLLALVMIFSLVPIQSFAAVVEVPAANLTLKDGQSVAISKDMNPDQVKKALFDALVANPEGADYSDYAWEYYAPCHTTDVGSINKHMWGDLINGFSEPDWMLFHYDYYPIKNEDDGSYKVRLKGNTQEVTVNKVSSAKISFSYDLTMGKVESNGKAVPANANVSPTKDYSFTATPGQGYKIASVKLNGKDLGTNGSYTVLPVANTNIEVKFAEDGTFFNVNFVPTEGVTIKLDGRAVKGSVRVAQGRAYKLEYVPANDFSVYKVRIDNEDITSKVTFKNYVGTQTVNFNADTQVKAEAVNVNNELVLSTKLEAGYAINSDGTPNWAAIRENFVNGFIDNEKSALVLTPENTEFQEWKQLRLAGGGRGAWSWVKLEGEKKELGTYFEASRPGSHLKFHVRFLGNNQFKPTNFIEFYGNVIDVQKANIALKKNPTVTIKETKVGVFDYSHLKQDVFNAAIDTAASAPNVTINDITLKIPENITTSGNYKVTASYPGSTSYYKSSVTFDVTVHVEYLPKANIVLNKNTADLVLKETKVGVYDNAALKEAAFSALVNTAECQKNGLDVSKIKIDLENVTTDGTYTVKFTYAQTDVLHANEVTAQVNVTVDKCPRVSLKIGADTTATLYKNYDASWNYNDLKDQIFALLTVDGVKGLTREDFNFQYLLLDAMNSQTGADTGYQNFEFGPSGWDVGKTYHYLNKGGEFQIKVSIPTTDTYYGCEDVFTIKVNTADKFTTQIIVNEGQPYNLTLNKNKDGSWNYDALKKALFEAAVKEVKNGKGNYAYNDFNYQYNLKDAMGTWTGAETGYRDFSVELVGSDAASTYKYLYKGGLIEFKIILPGVEGSYHGTEVLVNANITTADPFKSTVNVKKDAPALTLTETTVGVFDVETLKHEIYDKVIDFASSTPSDIKFEELEFVIPTITKTGDYQITVKFLGNFNYNESSVTFKLHVDVNMLPTANVVLKADVISAELKETEVNFFDMETFKKSIFDKAVDTAASSPKMTYEDVEITFDREVDKSGKYYATIKFLDTDKVHSSSASLNVDVTVNALPQVKIDTQHRRVTLNKNLDNTWNYEEFKKAVFDACVKVTGVDGLTYDKFDFKYFLRQGGAVFVGQNEWYAFEQGQLNLDPTNSGVYLCKGGNDFEIEISIPDSATYHGAKAKFTIDVDLADPFHTEIVIKPSYEKNFVLNYNAQGELDYDRLKREIFNSVIDAEKNNDKTTFENMVFKYQILNDLGVDDSKMPGGLSGHYYDFEQGWLGCDLAGTYRYLYKGGNFNVKLIIPASETTRQSEAIVNINVTIANRVNSNIVLKDLTTPYSADPKEIKQAIFNSIDLAASKLPQNVTVDDFKYEYYTINYTAGDFPGVEHRWVPVEGMKHPTLLDSYFKNIQVGSYAIRVTYRGNENYKDATSNEARIVVTGRDFTISFTDNDIYLDEKIPASYIKPSVEDNFTKFEIFAYMDGKTDTTIYIDTAAGLNKELAFAGNVQFNHVLLKIFGIETILSADEVYYRRGLSRAELETLVNHPLFVEYMQYYHNVDAKACKVIADSVKALPANITHIWFKIGQPSTPGTYRALGIAALANYNTATASQDFFIRFHSRGTKLVWWQDKAELNVFTAKNFDFRAVLTKNGLPMNSDHVKYIYTGFRANGMFYASTKKPPREAGIYTQTAYTGISGRYAFPKTRTFVIGIK